MLDFQEMRRLIREEERLRWALKKKRSRAEKITASFSQSGGGGISTGDKVGDGAVELVELQDAYDEIREALEDQRKELREAMKVWESHRNGTVKTCMELRYLKGRSVRKIAAALDYSEQNVFKMLKRGERLAREAETIAAKK